MSRETHEGSQGVRLGGKAGGDRRSRAGEEFIPTRDSLLSRLKNWDDQESWLDFFNTYWRLIYRMAVQAGLTDAEAQDVVQATLISVAKNIRRFRKDPERGSFKGWLLNTTRWRVNDQFRKRQRAGEARGRVAENDPRTDEIERIPDPNTQVLDEVWEREWEETLLEAAIERVKLRVEPGVYQLFDLHVVQRWPAPKVAEKLGVGLSQVYAAKYKLSPMIRKEVERLKKEMV